MRDYNENSMHDLLQTFSTIGFFVPPMSSTKYASFGAPQSIKPTATARGP
jgi:hypothetical protein